jgi:hypothetical protein
MTDKERIEQIKRKQFFETGSKKEFVHFEDVIWLIEQAERVQDLKIMLKVLGRQTERFKKALEFYADKNNWIEYSVGDDYVVTAPGDDNGETARKALEVRND